MKPSELRIQTYKEELKDCGTNPPPYFRARDINWLIERIETLEKRNERLMEASSKVVFHCVNSGNYDALNISPDECTCVTCNFRKVLSDEGVEE